MLGFVCAPNSPRYVSPKQIFQVVRALPHEPHTGELLCERVGVFVNASLDIIQMTVAIGHLNWVQLHGDESPDYCGKLKQHQPATKLIKALRIKSNDDLVQADRYQSCVDLLLLDAYHPTIAGGTGKTLDWPSLQSFQPSIPWLLAGGLNPANITHALAQLHPTGIDLSSGVEVAPGNKDMTKVAQLFVALEQCGLFTKNR